MAKHRLPGMSISAEQWTALGDVAAALDITRTELIRRAISKVIDEARDPVVGDLMEAQRQLIAIKAVLARTDRSTVAA
jgi:hypothetical protein